MPSPTIPQVLHIITDTNLGGAGRHVLNFLSSCTAQQVGVQVLCPPEAEIQVKCQELGVRCWVSSSLEGDQSLSVTKVLGLRRELQRLRQQEYFDGIHTHGSFTSRLAAVSMPQRPWIVYTKHRLDGPDQSADSEEGKPQNPPNWRKKLMSRLNQSTCDHAVAVSQAVRDLLLAQGMPSEQITLIYNGMDVAGFQRQAQQPSNLPLPVPGGALSPPAPSIGIIARLEAEKGHLYFLAAATQIRRKYPEAVFWVVGGGSLAEEIVQQVQRLSLSNQVVFTGFREDIPQILKGLDVLVVPSLTEAFGLSLLEGMCLAKPCVASGVGGILEIAEDQKTALLVPPGEAAILAEKILDLLDHPEKALAIGKQAAQAVENHFSATKMAVRMTELYQSLTEERNLALRVKGLR